jgi:acetyl esterase/lipase
MGKYRFIIAFSLVMASIAADCQSEKPIPKDTSYNPPHAWSNIVKRYPNSKIVPSNVPAGVRAHYDLVYATLENTPYGKRDLHLDIFTPAKEGRYPALVMIHGGAWRSGTKEMEHPMGQYAAAHGYVAVPVEYRMSLEAKYPHAVYDIKAAIRWIKANAEKYSIDTSRIAIEGESAGGHLAALVGMTNNLKLFEGAEGITSTSSTVQAVVDIDGVVDFLAPGSLNSPGYPDWLGGPFTEKPAIWKEASPVFYVGKQSVPIVFITSSLPKYTAGKGEMIDLLDQNGIYSETHKLPDSPHSFWLFEPWFEPTVNFMVTFLDKVLKKNIDSTR